MTSYLHGAGATALHGETIGENLRARWRDAVTETPSPSWVCGTRHAGTWLFAARESWGLPVLSHGRLYVAQNARDTLTRAPPRLLCYDLRA